MNTRRHEPAQGTRPVRRVALLATCALLAVAEGCACEIERAEQTLSGMAVTIEAESGVLVVERDGRELMRAPLFEVAARSGDAIYDMQFGMFDIVDLTEEAWRSPDALRITSQEGSAITFALTRGEGAPFAEGSLAADGPGHVVLTLGFADDVNRQRVSFGCAPGDHFVGLGAQTHDVDHRGQIVPLWVSEQGIGKTDDDELPLLWQVTGRRHTTHVPQPAMVTSRGTALVLDSYAYAELDLCASDEGRVTFESWEPTSTLVVHLFDGPSPLEALGRMSDHLGRPRTPPPWIFAPWNDAIFGSDEVRAFAHFLRDNEIPSSAIWSEDWRGGKDSGDLYRLDEDWRLDRELYPDYEALAAELRALGFAPQVYFNTFVTQGGDVFDEITSNGYAILDERGEPYLFDGADAAFSPTALVDLTNEDALAYTREHLENALALGAMGWMADYAEWMPVTGAKVASGEDPAVVHNEYPVLWAKLNDEVLSAYDDDENGAVAFHRSGHLYSQRYVQVMWAGDQRTSFQADDGLPTIIPLGVGLAATGFLFYAHDVAGYQSSTNPPVTKELFFRWTELGAFSPVMRTHHGTHARFNWNLQSDEESTAHWRRYASIHIRLYPYLRSLALDAVTTGRPLWIPTGLLYPDDEEQWGLKDQVFLGDALLVAPVVSEGATERAVRFPAGRFAPFLHAGDVVEGPATVTVPAPLGEIPVYLRAGGIVPMTANTPMTLFSGVDGIEGLESTEGDRVLYVGLGADGVFVEESGARYELVGDGTDASGLTLDDEGAAVIEGDGQVQGGGFTLVLTGHPQGRTTRVFFR